MPTGIVLIKMDNSELSTVDSHSADAVFFFGAAFLAAGFLAAAAVFGAAFFAGGAFFAAGFAAAFFGAAFFFVPDFPAFSAIRTKASSNVTASGSTPFGRVALTFSHFT